jgi:hypothetical protein
MQQLFQLRLARHENRCHSFVSNRRYVPGIRARQLVKMASLSKTLAIMRNYAAAAAPTRY